MSTRLIALAMLACGTPTSKRAADGAPDTAVPSTTASSSTPTAPVSTTDSECVAGPGPRLVRRLTHAEYGAAVRALLGTELAPETGFAPDLTVEGYANDASLAVSSLLAEQYRAAAEELAAATDVESVVPCDTADRECADAFIGDWGLRAYRRPLTDSERTSLLRLYDEVAAEDGFEEGVRWVITAALQSPAFLYRSELGARTAGEVFSLNDWELATALAFGVTGGPPDAGLLEAAAGGRLGRPDGLQAELDRLLADPRAPERVADSVAAMLQLERLPQVVREGSAYEDLTAEIREAMTEETRRLTADVASTGGGFGELLTADHTFLTAELATFYALPAPSVGADGWGRVSLPPERAGGLLSQGAVLATHALPTSSSPIHRGVMVRERLLCQHLPPPPADLNISPPPVDPSLSTRERYAAHSDVPECAGCHLMIDPVGFGFEHFDGIGRYREMDGVHPVDASGEVVASPSSDGLFVGIGELASLIVDDAEDCWVHRSARTLTGLELPECDVALFADETGAAGGSLFDTWQGWVQLPHFRERVGGSDERDAPLGDDRWTVPDPDPDLSEPGDTGLPGDVVVEETVQTDWGDGYCMDVVVVNGTAEPVVWSIELALADELSSNWSSTWTELDVGLWRVEGEGWNSELEPGAETAFGYCALR